ncbi:hypothetical protein PAESOLCIP111_01962 [Paenibacillus solanacearum]|uniref:Uncharacterized protein n=1 Tax=Paenibacillus solanacearum TaxID=2048548 RepID=A0A916K2C3_9BACL|nr:hypothetical protein PAESOLCIP111_01962 [Paenibacillus solanacearum]
MNNGNPVSVVAAASLSLERFIRWRLLGGNFL